MSKFPIFVTIICTLSASPVLAERTIIETLKGVEQTASAGSVIWRRTDFESVPGVIIDASIRASWSSAGSTDLPEKSKLIIVREKPFRACSKKVVLSYGIPAWQNCATDKNGDGLFDLVGFYDGSILKKAISPPVRYVRSAVPMEGPDTTTVEQSLAYLGISGDSLRVSYREFVNSLIRPAFSEEVTVPVPKTYPQTVAIKDVKLTILGVGPLGLKYRVE